MAWGEVEGVLHTMPLRVCLPCQECDLVICPEGVGGQIIAGEGGGREVEGGELSPLPGTASRDSLPVRHHSRSVGCNQPAARMVAVQVTTE